MLGGKKIRQPTEWDVAGHYNYPMRVCESPSDRGEGTRGSNQLSAGVRACGPTPCIHQLENRITFQPTSLSVLYMHRQCQESIHPSILSRSSHFYNNIVLLLGNNKGFQPHYGAFLCISGRAVREVRTRTVKRRRPCKEEIAAERCAG